MDWFSWFSKTAIDPSISYEYARTFVRNELEANDVAYFNHEFLQSMGISVAKHRLEILKLAREERRGIHGNSMSTILVKIKQVNRFLVKCIRKWVPPKHQDDSAVVLSRQPKRSYSLRWREAMLKRNSGFVRPKQLGRQRVRASKQNMQKVTNSYGSPGVGCCGQERLLLTYGSPMLVPSPLVTSFSGPLFHDFSKPKDHQPEEEDEEEEDDGVLENGFFPEEAEEIRWHAMFQNLKPT